MPVQSNVSRDWVGKQLGIEIEFRGQQFLMDFMDALRIRWQVDFHSRNAEVIKITRLWENIKARRQDSARLEQAYCLTEEFDIY